MEKIYITWIERAYILHKTFTQTLEKMMKQDLKPQIMNLIDNC